MSDDAIPFRAALENLAVGDGVLMKTPVTHFWVECERAGVLYFEEYDSIQKISVRSTTRGRSFFHSLLVSMANPDSIS